jgi:hypothetical protein
MGRKIYSIPPETEFFSVALQENVSVKRTLYVKETHFYEGKPAFGTLQIRFENIALQQYFGDDAIGYADKAHGEISIDFKKCTLVKEIEENLTEIAK